MTKKTRRRIDAWLKAKIAPEALREGCASRQGYAFGDDAGLTYRHSVIASLRAKAMSIIRRMRGD